MPSHSAGHRQRRRVQVLLLRDAGRTYVEIALATGLSRTGVFNICKHRDAPASGASHGNLQKRRQPGAHRLLQPGQEAVLLRLVAEHTPDQLGLPECLWTRAGVGRLIEQRCGIHLLARTTRLYLQRWGYGLQPGLHPAGKDLPVAFQRWLDDDYPAIVARARAEAAEIHWGDESQSAQNGVALLSTVTNRGQRHWMGVAPAPDADALIDFLHRLTRNRSSKLFLMPGNLPVDGGGALTAWLTEHDEEIEVIGLPAAA